ncbi:MAG: integrase [Alkaliphilus sp.]|nr:tyrosine-type recombinase/integrase [bacterium AH-315-L21]PHS33211.1 MAG: integrase [Alkaliphilus sp.]
MNYNEKLELYFELKNTPEASRKSYFKRIEVFIKFAQEHSENSIEELTLEDAQSYILHLKKNKGLTTGTINAYMSVIKFFYIHILDREWDSNKVPRMRMVQKFAVIPPRGDIMALLDKATNLKHKSFLVLMYGSGLRVGEVAKLKISDICSKTMRVRVDNAKHNTNRYSILSNVALKVLRDYFKVHFSSAYAKSDWLFPGKDKGKHISTKTIKNTIIRLRNQLHLDVNISASTLRHCFATYMLEDGVDPVFIQQLLGHRHLKTTVAYLHMTSKSLMGIKSPLDT